MDRIAFVLPVSMGHVIATTRLAELAHLGGYDVHYLLLGRRTDDASRGAVVDVVEGLGFEMALFDVPALALPPGLNGQPRRAVEASWASELVDLWRAVGEALETLAPRLVLFDVFLPPAGVLASSMGMACAQISTDLPHRVDLGAPPGPAFVIPGRRPWHDLRLGRAWTHHLARSIVLQKWSEWRGPTRMRAGRLALRHLMRTGRRAPARVSYRTAFPVANPGLHPRFPDLPELVFTGKRLDFPRRNTRGLHWLGPLVQERRPRVDFPFERLDPDRKLIYCSFGTEHGDEGTMRHVLAMVREAAAELPGHQLVLVTGAVTTGDATSSRRGDVIEVPFAPQLEILRRADVAVFHGGFNTLRECMVCGVPMLVVPIHPRITDRPRNGALVEYLGLGRCVRLSGSSPAELRAQIRSLSAEEAVRSRCRGLSAELKRSREARERNAIDVLHRLAASP